jgi:hypothetical protein
MQGQRSASGAKASSENSIKNRIKIILIILGSQRSRVIDVFNLSGFKNDII